MSSTQLISQLETSTAYCTINPLHTAEMCNYVNRPPHYEAVKVNSLFFMCQHTVHVSTNKIILFSINIFYTIHSINTKRLAAVLINVLSVFWVSV